MSRVSSTSDARGPVTDLAGKYRLIAELGQGGMASVYLAVAMGNSGFRKLAVVKLLRPEIAVDAEFVQMFLDEAKLCARLSHPNIVHTYDVGVDEVGHLMAMEYLDGVSLHAAIARLARNQCALTFPMQARVLLDVLEGLRYAHELKDYDGRSLEIVHRDVTPHNIFVTYEGQVKLLDFGIAKAATSSVRTATGVIKGKLTYMAPEQARGEHVDARADLYAVGVMLWEAVTGKRRWPSGLSQPALFTRLASGEPPESPNAAAHGYPAAIDDVVLKSLAPKPEDRFQTAAEFRDALEAAVQPLGPVSLRDLGGMLATAFHEGRERLRVIIEDQFRSIDAGSRPSLPQQLPAVVHPGSLTGSDVLDMSPPPIEGANKRDDDDESRSRRLTVSAPKKRLADPRVSVVRRRAAIGVGAALCAAVIVLGTALVHRARTPASDVDTARATPDVARAAAGKPNATEPAAAAPSSAPQAPFVAVGVRSPGVETAPEPAPAEAPERSSSAHRGGRPVALVPSPARSARPAALAPESVAASSTAPAAASDDAPPPEPVIRRPDGKPKVQLERENPWP